MEPPHTFLCTVVHINLSPHETPSTGTGLAQARDLRKSLVVRTIAVPHQTSFHFYLMDTTWTSLRTERWAQERVQKLGVALTVHFLPNEDEYLHNLP